MFRIIKISFILASAFIFVACGGWSSKEKATFMQDCQGGSDKDEQVSLCKCVYDIVSDEFDYSEYIIMDNIDNPNLKKYLKDTAFFYGLSFDMKPDILLKGEYSRLEAITPKIKECY